MAPDLNDAARAAFADYLLRHGGVIDDDYEEFLDAHAGVRDELVRLARVWSGRPPASPDEPPPSPAVPRAVDGFEIVREIGRGGMGIVYEAEQRRPHRRVALKVMRGELVDRERMKRIELEGQVLALLKHPSIVPLYGTGRTSDGSPWFAMEYVNGLTLKEAMERRRPSVEARLVLFRQICDAIAYAHQKGVIHRDLKPSNIVLSDETLSASGDVVGLGQVKILDFGLARITDADVSLVSMPSDAGHIVGTLAYMSPEQVRGRTDDVDQRSDVYALGVILYEMLTGRRPYDLDGCWLGEAAERIERTEPPRLGSVDRTLRGDLETIVRKALEKDPRRRYQSVSSLAEDVDRFRQGFPILAHPPSAVYQLKKLVLRHKAQAAAVAVLLASVLLVAALVVWRARSVARERDVAATVVRFQQAMLASVDPGRDGREVKVIDVLARAADELDGGAVDVPEVEAALRHTIGTTYQNLGLYDDAEPHLARALALRRAHLGGTRRETLATATHLANVFLSQDRVDEAEELYVRTLRAYEREYGADEPGALTIRSNLGLLLERRGHLEEAARELTDVLADRVRVLGPEHQQVQYTRSHLGSLQRTLGRLDEAEEHLVAAYAIRRDRHGDDHPTTLTSANQLGLLRHAQGRLDEAETLLKRTLDARRRVLGDHPDTWTSLGNLAAVHQDQGRMLETAALCREAFDLKRAALGDDHEETLTAQSNLAVALKKLGRLGEAERLARDVLKRRARVLGDPHPDTLRSVGNLAALLVLGGEDDREEAETLARRSLSEHVARFGDDHVSTITARNTLAFVLHRQDRHAEAEAMFRRSLRSMTKLLGAKHPNALVLTNNLASVLRQSCRFDEVEVLLAATLQTAEARLPGSLTVALLHSNAGMLAGDRGDFAAAEEHLLLGHAISVRNAGPEQHNARIIEAALRTLYTRWGFDDRAARYRPIEAAEQ